jgi:DNA-binding MarR family transcriptional regulator
MSSSPSIVDLAFDLGRLLRQAMIASNPKHAGTLLRLQGLLVIKEQPGITMKDLAAHLRVSASTATAFVDRVAMLGLVKRESDANNRKLVRLRLTPNGSRHLSLCLRERRNILRRAIARIPSEDRQALRRILLKLVSNLQTPPL